MQTYIIARANKDRLRKWMEDLSAQWFPIEIKDDKGNIQKGKMQVGVREVKLLEIAYPKEYESQIMGLIKPSENWGQSKKFTKIFQFFGRLLGLKKPMKFEDWTYRGELMQVDGTNVHIIALGTKPDVVIPWINHNADTEEKI